MADKKTREDAREQLANLDPKELTRLLSKKVKKLQNEIEQKDALIADLSSQKNKIDQEADIIIADAQSRAKKIEDEADALRASARRIERDAEEEAARKISNARAEANSILDTTLNGVKKDIAAIEDRRDHVKRDAITFIKDVMGEVDELIISTNQLVSSYKDVRARLDDQLKAIETEEFKRFHINDYVAAPAPVEVPTTSSADDDDLSFDELRSLLADDDEEDEFENEAEEDEEGGSFAFDVEEEDSDLVNEAAAIPMPSFSAPTTPASTPVIDDDEFEDWNDFSFDADEFDDDDVEEETQQSFTAAFMPVTSGQEIDDEFEDIDDVMFEDIEDVPASPAAEDIDFEDIMEDLDEPESPLRIPQRPDYATPSTGEAPRWL